MVASEKPLDPLPEEETRPSTTKGSGSGRIFQGLADVLIDRLMLVLVVLFLGAGLIFVWRLNRSSEQVAEAIALDDARLLAITLTEFRTLYTSEVVARVQGHGIPVTHDYPDHENAIPLPATMTIELGKRIGTARPGSEIRLFSDYPFSWRKDGGPHDEFERSAIEELRRQPARPYYRFEDYRGVPSLRFAVADTMRSSCVRCHNTHPDSPKQDWKVGDVRGVLEIVEPLDEVRLARRNMHESSALFVLGGSCSVIALSLTLGRLRKNSRLLHERNEQLNVLTSELTANNEVLEKLSTLDPLTGLLNRRSLDNLLDIEWRRAQRDGRGIALMMIDIDAFKKYNDRYGHLAGDACLRSVAEVLTSAPRRAGDWTARYGGEEFLIILPGASEADAFMFADGIRAGVDAEEIPHAASDVVPHVTVSIGVAEMRPSPDRKPSDLIELADRALYAAKRNGRNRVERSSTVGG